MAVVSITESFHAPGLAVRDGAASMTNQPEPWLPPAATSPFTIVSGGQTGVDRAALDAALAANAPCGGWCPDGRKAEDGVIPARYPLVELPGAGYLARTRRNVEDSDATLVVAFGTPAGGTARTVEFCRRLGKACLLIDAAVATPEESARRAREFVKGRGIAHLNVAGPRASGQAAGYAYAFELVTRLLSGLSAS